MSMIPFPTLELLMTISVRDREYMSTNTLPSFHLEQTARSQRPGCYRLVQLQMSDWTKITRVQQHERQVLTQLKALLEFMVDPSNVDAVERM